MANCPNCNNDLVKAPSWVYQNKTFSREICSLCGHKGKAFVVSQPPKQPLPPKGEDLRSYAMSYAKDLVVAMINQGLKIDKPGVKVAKIFRTLYKEISNPFTVKYQEEHQTVEIDFPEEDHSEEAI